MKSERFNGPAQPVTSYAAEGPLLLWVGWYSNMCERFYRHHMRGFNEALMAVLEVFFVTPQKNMLSLCRRFYKENCGVYDLRKNVRYSGNACYEYASITFRILSVPSMVLRSNFGVFSKRSS